MARHKVTFRLSATAYETIKEEAVSRGDESTVLSESREALAAAAELTNDGVWVVGCAEEASWDIEDWFEKAAAVESAAPKGDAGRFEMLKGAVRAIRDGRAKSRREKK